MQDGRPRARGDRRRARDKITIAKLNIDENPQIARDYQVMSIPTMTVFQGGKPVKSIIGAKPKGAILSDLADFI